MSVADIFKVWAGIGNGSKEQKFTENQKKCKGKRI